MKVLPLLLALIFLNGSWAQIAYRPIPETDATWIQAEFLYGGFHEHETVTSAVYTLGDTLINGQAYIRFGSHGTRDWIDGYGSQNQTSGGGPIPYETGCFRQDTIQKKVYLWNNTSQSDELLYDFGSLVIGQPYPETTTNLNYPNLMVLAQDSVQLIDGNYYKRWVLGTDSSDSAYVSVIEGVGGTSGFNTPIHPVFEQESHLLCHKVGTQHIYEDWQTSIIPPEYSEDCSKTLSLEPQTALSLVVFPNPGSTFVSVQSTEAIEYLEIYNLNGQSLFSLENLNNSNTLNLDLNNLEQGTYLLKVVMSNGDTITQSIQLMQ